MSAIIGTCRYIEDVPTDFDMRSLNFLNRLLHFFWLFALPILFFTGCKSAIVLPLKVEEPVAVMEESHPVLHLLSVDSSHAVYQKLYAGSTIYEFYKKRGFVSLWLNQGNTSQLVDSIFQLIENSRYYGLLPNEYHWPELHQIKEAAYSDGILLRREVLLLDAFLRFNMDVRHGRLQNPTKSEADTISLALLDSIASGVSLQNLVNHQEPDIQYYRDLKKAMRFVLDSLPASSRKFLLEGFSSDSIVGFREVKAIEINMERLRRERTEWDRRYILINIPAYTLQVIVQDTLSFQSRVIVGDPEHRTPELSSVIECFTLYPYWYVPRKISVEEYLPILQRDPSFITRNNFDVLNRRGEVLSPDSVPWPTFHQDYFPVSLRQREGTENSLGLVKFIFDNPYAVYLHDTNAKRSFSYRIRALSHGCVRVERAMDLAHYLYLGRNGVRSRTIERYVDQKKRTTINLSQPIPLYIRYYTCEFLHNQLHIYPDVYQVDQRLISDFYRIQRSK